MEKVQWNWINKQQNWLKYSKNDKSSTLPRELIIIGSIWPVYPNSSEYLKCFSCCIVCISNGSFNRIWYILAHVISYFCNSRPCLHAFVGEIKCIYFIYLLFTKTGLLQPLINSNQKIVILLPTYFFEIFTRILVFSLDPDKFITDILVQLWSD